MWGILILVGVVGIAILVNKLEQRLYKPPKIPFKELTRFEGNVISLAEFRAKRMVLDARKEVEAFGGYGHATGVKTNDRGDKK